MRPPHTRHPKARRARHHGPDDLAERVSWSLDQIHARLEYLDMAAADVKAVLKRIDTATDNIAADIKRLKDVIKPGMTDQEVADVQEEAERIAGKLEGIAADPDNPDPAGSA